MEEEAELTELLAQIDKLKKSGKLVLVEGIKDKNSLAELGITNVLVLKKALFAVAEQVSETAKECVILTDFDKEGKELYGRLKNHLEKVGVKIDDEFRNFLIRNTHVTHVEGLSSYIEHLQEKQ